VANLHPKSTRGHGSNRTSVWARRHGQPSFPTSVRDAQIPAAACQADHGRVVRLPPKAGMAASRTAPALEQSSVELGNSTRYPQSTIGYQDAGIPVECRQRLSPGGDSIACAAVLREGVASAGGRIARGRRQRRRPTWLSTRFYPPAVPALVPARSSRDAASLVGSLLPPAAGRTHRRVFMGPSPPHADLGAHRPDQVLRMDRPQEDPSSRPRSGRVVLHAHRHRLQPHPHSQTLGRHGMSPSGATNMASRQPQQLPAKTVIDARGTHRLLTRHSNPPLPSPFSAAC